MRFGGFCCCCVLLVAAAVVAARGQPAAVAKPLCNSCRGVATGAHATCVVTNKGSLRCFGMKSPALGVDDYGALLAGNLSPMPPPDAPFGATDGAVVEQIAAVRTNYFKTCAVMAPSGKLYCFGLIYIEEAKVPALGYPRGEMAAAPHNHAIQLLSDSAPPVKDVSIGSEHICALTESGQVICFGRSNDYFELGSSNTSATHQPPSAFIDINVKFDDKVAIAEICSGLWHNCARSAAGDVWCWGYGYMGMLGQASQENIADPSAFAAISLTEETGVKAVKIACGDFNACAVLSNGKLKCWGQNGDGQCGVNDTSSIGVNYVPSHYNERNGFLEYPRFSATGVDVVVDVACGDNFCCALVEQNGGQVYCFGSALGGRSGRTSPFPQAGGIGKPEPWERGPAALPSNRAVEAIAAGGARACARVALASGEGTEIYCWGDNEYGACGTETKDGTFNYFDVPSAAVILSDESETPRVWPRSTAQCSFCDESSDPGGDKGGMNGGGGGGGGGGGADGKPGTAQSSDEAGGGDDDGGGDALAAVGGPAGLIAIVASVVVCFGAAVLALAVYTRRRNKRLRAVARSRQSSGREMRQLSRTASRGHGEIGVMNGSGGGGGGGSGGGGSSAGGGRSRRGTRSRGNSHAPYMNKRSRSASKSALDKPAAAAAAAAMAASHGDGNSSNSTVPSVAAALHRSALGAAASRYDQFDNALLRRRDERSGGGLGGVGTNYAHVDALHRNNNNNNNNNNNMNVMLPNRPAAANATERGYEKVASQYDVLKLKNERGSAGSGGGDRSSNSNVGSYQRASLEINPNSRGQRQQASLSSYGPSLASQYSEQGLTTELNRMLHSSGSNQNNNNLISPYFASTNSSGGGGGGGGGYRYGDVPMGDSGSRGYQYAPEMN